MVSTRDGGIPEIIRHGENGYLVEREDVDSLVGYTQRLIDDENERRRMGERARTIVEQGFTAQPVRRLEEAYEALTEKRKIAWRSRAERTG
jgi:glycosyltransferase involved in cell wall biosynthesis